MGISSAGSISNVFSSPDEHAAWQQQQQQRQRQQQQQCQCRGKKNISSAAFPPCLGEDVPGTNTTAGPWHLNPSQSASVSNHGKIQLNTPSQNPGLTYLISSLTPQTLKHLETATFNP
jgi:transcription initiation factor TFIID subunit TAF12